MLKLSPKSALYHVPGIAFLISKSRLQIEYDLARKQSHDLVYNRAHTFTKQLLKFLKVNIVVLNHENVIKQPAIICQNHTSIMDIPAILHTVGGKSLFCTKEELFRIWVFGKGIETLGMIKIYKDDKMTGRELRKAANCLKEHVCDNGALTPYLVAFPEGTRTKDKGYKMNDFKRGLFSISIKYDLPIIPIASYGGLDITPKSSWTFNKGTIYEKVLTPLFPKDYAGGNIKEKSIRLQNDTQNKINLGIHELIQVYGKEKT
ncbi:MAG: 1-acyl-sn-glycerol-3-phosphate acyltransferase [Candidatus Scalindua sp. AMX11]|nr:MAG: 1-acyl-sn-glycerol-3-phosphate acyltransferase [Candidatus Scalindua sp.]NOG83259.1 1-acyl-sn-glycerol-3-phosphate acyltransferase [Planctomycetota bacterium]RZV71979.1 MAG: 1-acyl-sn-glycerol-3-phosphate acyltransferase [Candidatus Scalindua sp. SCAELEC01]TDE63373.1 MAG: 1-acyl-sn-glycerol-3-phosphate acyltransferase [Candidatus Scalindua sp. AMX11]GJQ60029.1 MAG: 1-acyl-sn-glycerol-3-phosphate acyltransferase [Candidatus Scalindua sp.]